MNKAKHSRRREVLVKFSGPIFFTTILAILCVVIFKYLPAEAPINNEYVISTNSTKDPTQVSVSDYHTTVVQHKNKVDLGLQLYRSLSSRASVIWFYTQITNNTDVALAILENADKNDIPLSLAFSLAYTESRYKVTAVNSNKNKSIDRGIFQLNNNSFPNLTEDEFFNPYVSANYGMLHLRFCLDTAGNEISALAMYNAGTTKVRNNKTPQTTLNYVSEIMSYREGLDQLFNSQVAIFYDNKNTSYVAKLN